MVSPLSPTTSSATIPLPQPYSRRNETRKERHMKERKRSRSVPLNCDIYVVVAFVTVNEKVIVLNSNTSIVVAFVAINKEVINTVIFPFLYDPNLHQLHTMIDVLIFFVFLLFLFCFEPWLSWKLLPYFVDYNIELIFEIDSKFEIWNELKFKIWNESKKIVTSH